MAGRFLNKNERERFNNFSKDISHDDLISFFTLSLTDVEQLPKRCPSYIRLGFAIQLCTLRYLGFSPGDLACIPCSVISFIAKQLDVEPEKFVHYANRNQTRTDHFQKIQEYLGFRKITEIDLEILKNWLVERALEHDRPILLLQQTCEKLLADKIIRPGLTILEGLILNARQKSHTETFRGIEHLLTDELKDTLDNILLFDKTKGCTIFTWLKRAANRNSPKSLKGTIEKTKWLKDLGVENWDLIKVVNPNRIKFLTKMARKSSNQMLQRYAKERRYPVLMAFLYQSLIDITDEVVDIFDRCLSDTYSRSEKDLQKHKKSKSKKVNENLILFKEIGNTILSSEIEDKEVRPKVYEYIPPDELRIAVEECDGIIRPKDDNCFDFLNKRYGHTRQFSPKFIEGFEFYSNNQNDELLEAVNLIRDLNKEKKRKIPDNVPLSFVSSKWEPYVITDNSKIDRHYYELCTISELDKSLRSGNIWLKTSRRHADPKSYLMPDEQWIDERSEICHQLQLEENGEIRLEKKFKELDTLLIKADHELSKGGKARIENDKLTISPIKAEDDPGSVKELKRLITERLPVIDITDILIDVDKWTGFSKNFKIVSENAPRNKDLLKHLYTCIIAQGCNMGLVRMAQTTGFSYNQLTWVNNWYLRDETLKSAINDMVNFHHNQNLSDYWGGGMLSSSDGQRFPVSGNIRNATSLPKYFGYGKGLTFYSWTSDQFSQYGTKVIPATKRDATYVLDEILDNETELQILEHTTDTDGYTELVFALFDLLGMEFSPRIKRIADQHLYYFEKKEYKYVKYLLKGKINKNKILKHWESILKIVGSLKSGWVTSSLLISKLQSYPCKNEITLALQEYGRLVKTIFVLKYITDENFRRKINAQLNKGEALHDLRGFLFFADHGIIRRKNQEEQNNQALCLNLLTNSVILWNTVYIDKTIKELRSAGHSIHDSDISYISPCRFAHVNPFGKYEFDLEQEYSLEKLRPLKKKD